MTKESIENLLDRFKEPITDENPDLEEKEKSRIATRLVELAKTDPTLIKRVIACLNENDYDVRYKAVSILLRVGPKAKEAVPVLLKLLQDQHEPEGIRSIAGGALGFMGPGIVPILARVLEQNKDMYVRRNIASNLCRTKSDGDEAIPVLINLLKDESWDVRLPTLASLRQFAPRSIKPLREALKHRNMGIKLGAAEALIVADPKSIPDVVPLLIETMQDSKGTVRAQAASAWGAMADVKRAFGETLAESARKKAAKVLTAGLRDKERRVRYNCTLALCEFGPAAKAASAELVKSLADDDEIVRGYSAMTLGRIRPPTKAAVLGLAATVNDISPGVGACALDALAELGPAARDAEPFLRKVLADPGSDAALRKRIKETLKAINPS